MKLYFPLALLALFLQGAQEPQQTNGVPPAQQAVNDRFKVLEIRISAIERQLDAAKRARQDELDSRTPVCVDRNGVNQSLHMKNGVIFTYFQHTNQWSWLMDCNYSPLDD